MAAASWTDPSAGSVSNEVSAGRVLLQFRAGRMNWDGGRVTADARKGRVRLARTHEGLFLFQWMERDAEQVEENLIVFPGEATWRRVSECTTGRVYLLEFHTSDKRLFFWMQEPRVERDVLWSRRVNNLLEGRDVNDGVEALSAMAAAVARPQPHRGATGATVSVQDLQQALQGLGHRLADTASTATTVGTPATEESIVGGEGSGGVESSRQPSPAPTPSLSDVLQLDMHLEQALQQEAVQQALQPFLQPLLPDGHDVRSVLRSPQFRQQMDALSEALLESGPEETAEMIRAFDIGQQGGGGEQRNGLELFLEALVRRARHADEESRGDAHADELGAGKERQRRPHNSG
eukprot:ctg_327.g164